MKKIHFLMFAMILTAITSCSTLRTQAYYDYDSRIIATERDGSYTIRAYGKGRNMADAFVDARKRALYDVLFTGVQSADSKVPHLKPVITEVNAKEKYESYFNKFFADGGDYNKYVSLKEKRALSTNYSRTDAQSMAEVTVCVFREKVVQRLREDGILPK